MPTTYVEGIRRPLRDLSESLKSTKDELIATRKLVHELEARVDLKNGLLERQSKLLIKKDDKINFLKEEVNARNLTIQNMYRNGWRI